MKSYEPPKVAFKLKREDLFDLYYAVKDVLDFTVVCKCGHGIHLHDEKLPGCASCRCARWELAEALPSTTDVFRLKGAVEKVHEALK